jgi:broad specificity phosphatase PhoE
MSGAVILARHGEPALSRKLRLNAAQYRDWWARYEAGGLAPIQAVPPELAAIAKSAGAVLSSTRERAVQSAKALGAGGVVDSDSVFIEAPLPVPPLPAWLRLSPRHWGFLSRFCWWWFNYHAGQESVAQAHRRAAAAARRLIERAAGGQDVLLVAHGFFNAMIGRALRARGWRRTTGKGFKYWSVRRFEAPRAPGVQGHRPMV